MYDKELVCSDQHYGLQYCTINDDYNSLFFKKYNGSVMYELRGKLVCLSKPEDTSLLRNLSFFHKWRIRNVL